MLTTSIIFENDAVVNLLASSLNQWPVLLPCGAQQAAQDAVAAYQSGDRSPEVCMCLAFLFTIHQANTLRYAIYENAQRTLGAFTI